MRTDRKDKEGLFPVRLRVTKKGKQMYISLKISGNPNFWDEEQERFVIEKGLRKKELKEANEERRNKNELLERYNIRAKDIIKEFEKKRINWTLNQFKETFLSKSKQGNIKAYTDNLIQTLRDTEHIGNANCYAGTLHMLETFDKKFKERIFSEIDIKFVKRFDVFLQKRGCKGNTRKYYHKALRAVLNKAIQDKEASRISYPFGKGGFEVAKLEEETEKRYLPTEYLNKIKSSVSEIPVNEYARKLFLFSYYCYGISWADMARLTQNNIVRLNKGQYIVYKREKTKGGRKTKPINIKLTSEIQSLIDELKAYNKPLDNFLLPIVTRSGYQGEQLYNHIKGRYKKYSKYLKALANELKISDINLTSYVSRHTMAMQLQENEIPENIISQIMGHKDLKTTKVYLDSLDTSTIDKASEVL